VHAKDAFIYALAAATIASALATAVLLLQAPQAPAARGTVVAVTFPSLKPDVEQLLCPGDRVYSVAPPGVDPHDYQLRPGDVQLLKRASVIVSTGHAPFEAQVASLVRSGEIRAELVEITRVPGVKLLRNPATGQLNLHMPIYDPSNYKAFIHALAEALARANPACRHHYLAAADQVAGRVDSIVGQAPRLHVAAVATTPLAQYAVSWLGVDVEYLLIKEHGLPASPREVEEIEAAAAAHRVGLVVVVDSDLNAPQGRRALEIAGAAGLPVLRVPSPLEEKPIPEKLAEIVAQARGLAGP